MSDGTFPTVAGSRLGGRDTTWESGVTQPVDHGPQRPSIPVAGLIEFVVIVLGLMLMSAGIGFALGWEWMLVAVGASLIFAARSGRTT